MTNTYYPYCTSVGWGYIEEGTTTTPFAMLASNKASRYHVAIEAIKFVPRRL